MPSAQIALDILGGGPVEGQQAPSPLPPTFGVQNSAPSQALSLGDDGQIDTSMNNKGDMQINESMQRKLDILAGKDVPPLPGQKIETKKIVANDRDLGALGAFTDSATNMMTFGLNKPFSAAGLAGLDYLGNKIGGDGKASYGDLYDQQMKRMEATDKIQEELHPIASGAGTFTGGIVSLGVAAPAKAIAATTQLAKPSMMKALGKSMMVNAGAGGIISGLNAAGYAEPGNRLEAGAKGTLIGGAAAAAVPVTLQVGGKIIGKLASPLTDRYFKNNEKFTLEKIAQAMGRDNLTLDEAHSILKNMGPQATIADVGGANVQGLARAAAGVPGEGKEIITKFLSERQSGQGGRVEGSLMKNIGANKNFYDAEAALTKQQELAAPLYNEAYKSNQSIQSKSIDRVLRTPAGKKALSEARVKMQNDMSLMGVPDKELAQQAKLIGQYKPGGIAAGLKLRTLDYVKRAFDDQIGSAISAGEKDNARILQGLKKSLVGALDEADITAAKDTAGKIVKPGKYAEARKSFAGPAQSKNALENGRKFILEDAEVTSREMAQMSDAEREMFRIGAARALRDKIQNTSYGSDSVKNIFGSPEQLIGSAAKRDRLATVFPSKRAFFDFGKDMINEAKMYQTRANVLQGSRTTPMAAELEDAGINVKPAVKAASGDVKGALMEKGMEMLSKLKMPEQVRGLVAKKLFSSDPTENAKTIQQLEEILSQETTNTTMNPLLGIAGQTGRLSGLLNAQ